jgi:dethiobiotin synthetase
MKRFMVLFPVVVVVSCLLGIVVNIFSDNQAAIMAYFLALLGWIVLAYEGIVDYRAEQKQAK